jgi:hypothetical protein
LRHLRQKHGAHCQSKDYRQSTGQPSPVLTIGMHTKTPLAKELLFVADKTSKQQYHLSTA